MARIPGFGLDTPLDFPFPAAAKTGTSRHFTDNWAVGATGRFTVAVWVGNFSGRPMDGVSGVSGAGPLLHRAVLPHRRSLSARRAACTEGDRRGAGANLPPVGSAGDRPLSCDDRVVPSRQGACSELRLARGAGACACPPSTPRGPMLTPPSGRTSRGSRQGRRWRPALRAGRSSRPLSSLPGGPPSPSALCRPRTAISTRCRRGSGLGTRRSRSAREVAPGGPVRWSVDGQPVAGGRWPLRPGSHVVRAEGAAGEHAVVRIAVD